LSCDVRASYGIPYACMYFNVKCEHFVYGLCTVSCTIDGVHCMPPCILKMFSNKHSKFITKTEIFISFFIHSFRHEFFRADSGCPYSEPYSETPFHISHRCGGIRWYGPVVGVHGVQSRIQKSSHMRHKHLKINIGCNRSTVNTFWGGWGGGVGAS